jgi:ribonuclease HI
LKGLYLLHIDGGKKASERGGTALGAYGFVLRDPKNTEIAGGAKGHVLEERVPDPHSAEYEGLLAGLAFAKGQGVQYLAVFSDSRTLVNQVNGLWSSRDHLAKYLAKACTALDDFKGWQVSWIPREWNDAADNEVRQAFKQAAGSGAIDHAD